MDEKVLRVGSDPIHLILSILSFISTLAEGFFAPWLAVNWPRKERAK
jgi:hypothetical protein